MTLLKVSFIALFFSLGICAAEPQGSVAGSDDKPSLKENTEVQLDKKVIRTKVYVVGDYITVGSPAGGQALSGFGVSFQGQFALNNNYAINISARQSFSFAGSGIITSFDGRLTYAISGKLMGEDKSANINGLKVVEVQDHDLSGFRVQLIASQYYFNASTTTVPYNGMGLSGYYEWANDERYNYIAGARFDQISNSEFSTSPLSVFCGLGIPF